MDFCIICLGDNPITVGNPLSDEHIFPEFVGGGLVVKNVCKICNEKMGTGFEAALANSQLYTIPRFVHGIKGKKKSLGHPFAGAYEHEVVGKFVLDPQGGITVVPGVDVIQLDDGISISMTIDAKEIENAKPILQKRLSRYLVAQGKTVDEARLSALVDEFLNSAERQVGDEIQPTISGQMTFDIDAHKLLFAKIAYELAEFHFGASYLDDTIAEKLRLMLKCQILDPNLMLEVPAEKPPFEGLFDDASHWVMFNRNYCYLTLFGLPALLQYAEDGAPFLPKEAVVYRFCYKTQSYESFSLLEHLACLYDATQK